MHWHLLDTGVRHAAWNMAIDEALLNAAAIEQTPVLRFYQWENPTLSLGYFQSIHEANLDACEHWGLDWIRRPTGGRAVLHDHELTYSIVGPIGCFGKSVQASYERLSGALARGLRKVGLNAELTSDAPINTEKNPVCFSSPAYSELTIAGKKVIGSAQMRTQHALLQHGSIPLTLHYDKLISVVYLKYSQETLDRLRRKAVGLEELLGHTLSVAELKDALRKGFEEHWGIEFEPTSLSEDVSERACQLFIEKYSTREWNYLR
jgi:lipoate-protein ligase A